MVDKPVTIHGVSEWNPKYPAFPAINFKNFSARPGKYSRPNVPDSREFVLFFNEEQGHVMEDEGWNIAWYEPREEGDERIARLRVKVNYNYTPALPRVIQIIEGKDGDKKIPFNEGNINILDGCKIERMDLTIRPHNRPEGTTAYLKTAYVILEEDELDKEYGDIPYADGYED